MKREAGGQGKFSVGRIFGAATPPPRGASSGQKYMEKKLPLNGYRFKCFLRPTP